jgi:hypothetical protein
MTLKAIRPGRDHQTLLQKNPICVRRFSLAIDEETKG